MFTVNVETLAFISATQSETMAPRRSANNLTSKQVAEMASSSTLRMKSPSPIEKGKEARAPIMPRSEERAPVVLRLKNPGAVKKQSMPPPKLHLRKKKGSDKWECVREETAHAEVDDGLQTPPPSAPRIKLHFRKKKGSDNKWELVREGAASAEVENGLQTTPPTAQVSAHMSPAERTQCELDSSSDKDDDGFDNGDHTA